MKGHVPAPCFSFDKSQITSRPLCMICSMDEMARAQALKLPRKKSINRNLSRRTQYTVKCILENCPVVAHASVPEDVIKVSCIPNFVGVKGNFYSRKISSHEVVREVKELYQSDIP